MYWDELFVLDKLREELSVSQRNGIIMPGIVSKESLSTGCVEILDL